MRAAAREPGRKIMGLTRGTLFPQKYQNLGKTLVFG
jgi:hypothetical protein